MGLWSTIKGWLNIGGVKVKIEGVDPVIRLGANQVAGKAVLTSKGDKEVVNVTCKVVHERKYKKDNDERTESTTLGETCFEGFSLTTGETREVPFVVDYQLDEKLQHGGGVMGAIGKLGAFASGSKDAYFVVASCKVKGTVLGPSAKTELKLAKKA